MLCRPRHPPEFQTVVLKVDMRTEKCKRKVIKVLQGMRGKGIFRYERDRERESATENLVEVEDYDVELGERKVTVTGRLYPKKFARKLESKTGKRTELWTERSLASASSRRSWRYSFKDSFKKYSTMFSDEDPNSCSVM